MPILPQLHPYAIITGASSGIGRQLAICCAREGYDVLIAADEPAIHEAADDIRLTGANADAVQVNLSTKAGVDKLYESTRGRNVDALLANAGHGLGRAGAAALRARGRGSGRVLDRAATSAGAQARVEDEVQHIHDQVRDDDADGEHDEKEGHAERSPEGAKGSV